ncbi:hypothetical protein PENSPDRAFT_272520 [Peniophora sp. CONT]|nr:hypothetical protein PENSPDRAFT_272520 [Peniophora sp. CONT]
MRLSTQRPRIHESHLSAVGEVCAVLHALMILDVPAHGSDNDSDVRRRGAQHARRRRNSEE